MAGAPVFPNDTNGDVLRRMAANGDDLRTPRNVDFERIFDSKDGAVAFLSEVASPSQEARLSWYQERSVWNVQVVLHMVPTHAEISRIEAHLDAIAKKHGGDADGWGCFEVVAKRDS